MRQSIALAFALGPIVGPSFASADDAPRHECLIAPNEVVQVASPVTGVVDEILVRPGDEIERGDVIARLRSEVERAAAAIARARSEHRAGVELGRVRAELARRKLERQDQLSQRNVASLAAVEELEAAARAAELDVQRAEFEVGLARLELARADALLDLKMIRAPIDGVVVERLLAPGEFASEQAQIVTLAQLDPLEVRSFVPTSYFGRIAPGDTALVFPDPPAEGRHEAVVRSVDRVFDAASGTMGVRLRLDNPDRTLPAGLPCRVAFPAAHDTEHETQKD